MPLYSMLLAELQSNTVVLSILKKLLAALGTCVAVLQMHAAVVGMLTGDGVLLQWGCLLMFMEEQDPMA